MIFNNSLLSRGSALNLALSMPSIPAKRKPEAAEEADTPFKRAQRTRKPTLKALLGDGSPPTQPIELLGSTWDPPIESPTQALEPPTQAIEMPLQNLKSINISSINQPKIASTVSSIQTNKLQH
jgi:hypothetical protein